MINKQGSENEQREIYMAAILFTQFLHSSSMTTYIANVYVSLKVFLQFLQRNFYSDSSSNITPT